MAWRYPDNPNEDGGGGPATAFDRLPAPCALIGPDGRVERANDAWQRGEAPVTAPPGGSFLDAIASLTRSDQAAQGLRDVLAGRRESFMYDLATAGAAGSRWLRIMAAARPEGGASVVVVDVTDPERGAMLLRENDARFRQIIESIQDYAIFTVDLGGTVTSANRAAERIMGFLPEETVGRSIDSFCTEEDRASGEVDRQMLEAQRQGRLEVEGWRVRKDGSRFWAHIVMTPLKDDRDRVRGFSKIVRDMTERRRAEVALSDSQKRLSGIIDSAMDAIITVDDQQRIVMFNHAAERIFGAPASEVIGGPLDRFIPQRFRRAHAGHIHAFSATGVTTRAMGRLGTLYGVRADGSEFPIEASISQAVAGGQKFFTVILRDVSERRRLEEQFLQSQKMEGIGRLAGGVAHDFNNLLTAFFGYVGAAASSIEPDHPAQSALAHAREAAERASTLTRQLLMFARKQIVALRVLSVNEVVTGVEPMLRRLLGEDILLRTVTPPGVANVRADRSQLEQVIVNLAVNARDAMPRGGTLTIETRNIVLDEEYCRARIGAVPGPHVELAVNDTGAGMSTEVMERLFEPFFTTKGPGKGTGLGLATCHGIIRQCGGHIAVYSELGRGTSVKVYLPRAEADAPAREDAGTRVQDVHGSETILLVEDNFMVRDLVARGLSGAGFNVLSASTGTEALALADRTTGRIDLLLTDVVMPEMGGVALAEALARRHKDIKVVFMSGYTQETIVHHGVETESVAFIAKPFEVPALLQKIRAVLDASHK